MVSLWSVGISSVGAMLVWAGINNADPVQVLRDVLQGKVPTAGVQVHNFKTGAPGTPGAGGDPKGSPTGSRATVVAAARSCIGARYAHHIPTSAADAKANGTDCSGLTKFAYAAVGINLPWAAGYQVAFAKAVKLPQALAQPGDLIGFFPGGYSGFQHIGMYTGGGMMIDSPGGNPSVAERKVYSGGIYVNILDHASSSGASSGNLNPNVTN